VQERDGYGGGHDRDSYDDHEDEWKERETEWGRTQGYSKWFSGF